jgi:hypothetical protein
MDSNTTLHLMLTPESIAKAKELAALKQLSLDELFVNLLLAEQERSKGQTVEDRQR